MPTEAVSKPKFTKEQQKIIDDLNAERESVAKKIKAMQTLIFKQEPTNLWWESSKCVEIISKQLKALQEYYEKLVDLIKFVDEQMRYGGDKSLPKDFKNILSRE